MNRHRAPLAVAVLVAAALPTSAAAAAPRVGPEVALAPPRLITAPGYNVVAAGGAAGHLVVWNSGNDVFCRVVEPGGKLGTVRLLTRAGREARVAFNGTHYFVTWWDKAAGPMWAVRLGADGAPLEAPVKIAESPFPLEGWDMACNPSQCAVVFEDRTPTNVSNVFAVRVSAAGVLVDPTPITVAATPDSAYDVTVASDGTDFLVAWVRVMNGLEARRLLADGSLAGSGPVLLAGAAQIARFPVTLPVAVFDGSGYAILWDGISIAEPKLRVLNLQRLDRAGNVLDPVPQELARGGPLALIEEQRNDLVVAGDHLLAFWITRDTTSTPTTGRLYTRAVGKDGQPLGPALDLGDEALVDGAGLVAALSVTAQGDVLAVWNARAGSAASIKAMPLSAAGQAGAAMPWVISEDVVAQGAPTGIWTGDDGWFVTWFEPERIQSAAALVGVRVSPSGELVDAAPRMLATGNPSVAGGGPRLSPLGDGFLAVWRSDQVKLLRFRADGTPLDPAPTFLVVGEAAVTEFRVMPLGREALLLAHLVTPVAGRLWSAWRVREDGTTAPYSLSPGDPLIGPDARLTFDAASAAGSPVLAQGRYQGGGFTIVLSALAPEGKLPASTSFMVRNGDSLALAGDPVGGLVSWIDAASAAPAFVRLSKSGAAIDQSAHFAGTPPGAPAAATSRDPAVCASAGGWLAAWRYQPAGAAQAAPPLAVSGVSAGGEATAATLQPLDSAATSVALVGGGPGGRALLLYGRPREYTLPTARAFARLVSLDDGAPVDAGVAPADSGPFDPTDAGADAPGAARADGGSVVPDSRPSDLGLSNDAAGPGRDALDPDAGAPPAPPPVAGRSGCGCRLPGAPDQGRLPVLLVVLAAAVLRRRARP